MCLSQNLIQRIRRCKTFFLNPKFHLVQSLHYWTIIKPTMQQKKIKQIFVSVPPKPLNDQAVCVSKQLFLFFVKKNIKNILTIKIYLIFADANQLNIKTI